MGLRDRQREATRALVLEAAARLVAERGPEAATTRAIAAAAGVATGTVFAHFPDKRALLEALLHDHVEAALNRTIPVLPATGLLDQLVSLSEGLYAAYDQEPALSRAMIAESLFLSAPEGPLAAQLQRFSAWLGPRFAEACARGEIAPIDPTLAFTGFFSLYFSVLVGGLRGEVPTEARGPLLRALLERFLRPA